MLRVNGPQLVLGPQVASTLLPNNKPNRLGRLRRPPSALAVLACFNSQLRVKVSRHEQSFCTLHSLPRAAEWEQCTVCPLQGALSRSKDSAQIWILLILHFSQLCTRAPGRRQG